MPSPRLCSAAFFVDDAVKDFCRLDGIVTLVDAKHIEQHLDEEKPEGAENEAIEQVAFADRLLLNKTDLVSDEADLGRIEARLRELNKFAPITRCQRSEVRTECSAPRRAAPHRTAPHHSAAQRSTPQRAAAQRSAPHRIGHGFKPGKATARALATPAGSTRRALCHTSRHPQPGLQLASCGGAWDARQVDLGNVLHIRGFDLARTLEMDPGAHGERDRACDGDVCPSVPVRARPRASACAGVLFVRARARAPTLWHRIGDAMAPPTCRLRPLPSCAQSS